jgi:hypothetical protein
MRRDRCWETPHLEKGCNTSSMLGLGYHRLRGCEEIGDRVDVEVENLGGVRGEESGIRQGGNEKGRCKTRMQENPKP